ncbi:MAG: SDR family NAD(P)-dependent oxidoreductase [Microcella sp.]
MTRALITGATAGIGLEFAHQLAARGDALVLVARTASRLDEVAETLRAQHGVAVETLVADLHDPTQVAVVDARVASDTEPVDLLINNAGYGIGGDLAATDPEDEQKHLAIHVAVPLRLTQTALKRMLVAGHGRIVIVSSVAAFTPRGTYGAAKAWGVSFARWANLSYRRRGVTVTAVAPGFVRTEFHDRMGVDVSGIPSALWLDAPTVVRQSLRAVERGRSVVIPTVRWKIIAGLARVLPDALSSSGQFRSR